MFDPLSTDPHIVTLFSARIKAFLLEQRMIHNSAWFTVSEIAEALNLSPTLSAAILAFQDVADEGLVEMNDGAIRYPPRQSQ